MLCLLAQQIKHLNTIIVLAPKPFLVEINTLANSKMAKETDTVYLPLDLKLSGRETNTLVNSRMAKERDKAPISVPLET
jgi:hypothetical protein